ncbi:MAG: sel1 repeat family protein, partial [Rhodospirillaceae bacterium]|nr:sel1 repeat family protein [Rhodospirillaceae bacterium]
MIRPLRLLGFVVLCVALFATAAAHADEDYEAGLAAYEAGDHDTARELWSLSAAVGNAQAATGLGELYLTGSG